MAPVYLFRFRLVDTEDLMVDTPETIAEKTFPGWKVVGTAEAGTHCGVDGQTPGMASMRKKYGLPQASRGLAPASSSEGNTEVIVMDPPADMASVGQKLVVVRNGTAVIVQG